MSRISLLISLYIFICPAVFAAQYPYGDDKSYLSQPYNALAITETYLTPYDNAEARLIVFLDQAQRYCYIASYSITNRNVINKLIQLHYRGVDVQVITDRTQAAGKNEQAALAALQANGIPVFAGKSVANGLLHVKFAVIDDHLVEDGSWNFTASANKEDNILNFVDSKPRAAQFLSYWIKIRSDMR